ncbi:hypothetical protein CBR_g58818 [Chara braunii]|uniref:Uncharacterized protein n=1 Tax=Chara braunii TaxID=69332 RepID=A0A388K8I4_CHABU|nr:hypothetical protein CBR_g58818 [Chara braunii]|eukprot:GBG66329.1 hypothetical protein CBR_g58818 [Chara braunii]
MDCVCAVDVSAGHSGRDRDGHSFSCAFASRQIPPWIGLHFSSGRRDDMIYVNLQLNPEKYTGYKGDSARKIWQAIYAESCFKDPSLPFVLTTVTSQYGIGVVLQQDDGKGYRPWGPNWEMMRWGVAKFPERVQNLHFTYLFVLRALSKAGDYLTHADYSTGNEAEDRETLELLKELVDNRDLKAACPEPFDEAQLWRGKEGPQLKQELQKHFRNISRVMDCVGCEKCRLWGKLQMLGLGTALKILFCTNENGEFQQFKLQRNEVIALVNTLGRFSEALKLLGELPPETSAGKANHQAGNVQIKSTTNKNSQTSSPS